MFLVSYTPPLLALICVFGSTLGIYNMLYYGFPILMGLATGIWILATVPKEARDEDNTDEKR